MMAMVVVSAMAQRISHYQSGDAVLENGVIITAEELKQLCGGYAGALRSDVDYRIACQIQAAANRRNAVVAQREAISELQSLQRAAAMAEAGYGYGQASVAVGGVAVSLPVGGGYGYGYPQQATVAVSSRNGNGVFVSVPVSVGQKQKKADAKKAAARYAEKRNASQPAKTVSVQSLKNASASQQKQATNTTPANKNLLVW